MNMHMYIAHGENDAYQNKGRKTAQGFTGGAHSDRTKGDKDGMMNTRQKWGFFEMGNRA